MCKYKIKCILFFTGLFLFTYNICPQLLLYANTLRLPLQCENSDPKDRSILSKIRKDIAEFEKKLENLASQMNDLAWWEECTETGHAIFVSVAELKRSLHKYKLIKDKDKDKDWGGIKKFSIYFSKRELEYFKTKSVDNPDIIKSYIEFYRQFLHAFKEILSAYEDIIVVAEIKLPISDGLLLELQSYSDHSDLKLTRTQLIVIRRGILRRKRIEEEVYNISSDLDSYFSMIGLDLIEIPKGTNVKRFLVCLMEEAQLSGKIHQQPILNSV